MAYLSLYRKYRPQFFADVVGQDHVVQTLQNALRSGRIANGYLFCGTRGVAKTTMARILAKGLNCVGANGTATVPQAEPCSVCAPCRAISAGQAVDVVEMDAASNRSVNDIAKLRESVQFGPMENRFKVYIVDEAHQLSSDAKDAFLKTLEEPPANVVFILATTETHAIPITIASRCQRFDFKRGSIGQIGKQINRVLAQEGVTIHADAIVLIARAADGSYRDALSLLDQVLAYKRQDITGDDVAEVLGTVKSDLLATTIQKIAESDFAGVFSVSEEIFNQGKDVRQFLKTLALRFRDMLFLSSGARSVDEDQTLADPVLRQQASQFSPAAMAEALTVITEAERETRNSNQHRLLLEMALLKLTRLPDKPKAILHSAPAALAPSPPTVPIAAIPVKPEPTSTLVASPEAEEDVEETPAETITEAEAEDEPVEEAIAVGEIDRLTIPMFGIDNEPAPLPASPTPRPLPVDSSVMQAVEAEERELIAESVYEGPNGVGTLAQSAIPDELQYLKQHWTEAVNHMGVIAASGVSLMKDGTPIDQTGQVITVEFTQSSFVARLESVRAMDKIQEVINKVLKKPPKTFKIKAVLKGAATVTPVPRKTASDLNHAPAVPDDAPSDLLNEVISVFGGRIIDDERTGR